MGCKVDESRKINVFFVNNFNSYGSSQYIKIIKNCVQLIDNNDYPIILLSIYNTGGVIYNSQLLLELSSPTTTINMYDAFRNNGIYKGQEIIDSEILSIFSDYEKCESFNHEKLGILQKK